MSLLLLASMPAASPDGPSDAEEGERRRGINTPPENGQQKRAAHMDVQGGLAPRADRLRLPLPILLKGERLLEQGSVYRPNTAKYGQGP